MKVAILTTHRANNFGAMLQAYSLVMACRELGADAQIIDWRNPFFEKLYHKAWRMHRNPIPAIRHLIWFLNDEADSRKMFADFRNSIPMSKMISKKIMLSKIESEYDSFIVGSDQVWNPSILTNKVEAFDRTYLLDFVKEKPKYAYAASLGDRISINESLQKEYAKELTTFAGITMREKEGSLFVENLVGKKIETVVDPVLLHDAEYWRRVAKARFNSRKRYALIYNLRRSRQLLCLAQKVVGSQNYDLINLLIPAQVSTEGFGMTNAGPAELLSYIDSAECIFTNSFHAAAFAIIYGRNLYVQFVKAGTNANSRMDNLFRLCGLTGRDVYEDSDTLIRFYDCSTKDECSIERANNRAKDILRQMIAGKSLK